MSQLSQVEFLRKLAEKEAAKGPDAFGDPMTKEETAYWKAADRIEELERRCSGALRYAYRIRDQHQEISGLAEHNLLGIIDVLEEALEGGE